MSCLTIATTKVIAWVEWLCTLKLKKLVTNNSYDRVDFTSLYLIHNKQLGGFS